MRWLVGVVLIIGILVGFYFLGKYFVPIETPFVEWMEFITMSIPIVLIISALGYLFYSNYYYKSRRLMGYDDVSGLRRPWVISLIAVCAVQFVVALVFGLLAVSEKPVSTVFKIIYVGLLQAVLGAAVYWIVCAFFPLPKRVKYVPFLRSMWR